MPSPRSSPSTSAARSGRRRSPWAATGMTSAAPFPRTSPTRRPAAACAHRRAERARLGGRMGRCAPCPGVRRDHARAQGTPLVGADVAELRSHRGADADRPLGPPAVERAEAGASTLYDRRSLGPPARRGDRAARRGRCSGLRDRGPHWSGRSLGGPLLPLSPDRGPLQRPADPSHHRRGLARPRRSRLRRPDPGVAEDASQEERFRRLRHPVSR